jgi:formylglycine-generating enzyme required for sulfatase activity
MTWWQIRRLFAGFLWLVLLVACRSSKHMEKTNPQDGLVYVWVAGGSYYTGCTSDDEECMGRERHRQLIVIDHGFWMGKTEVTQAAFERVMGVNPSRYRGQLHPVEQVDWQSARTYCSRIGMRLPTESEWEFAAAGGIDAPRYGSVDSIAWYDPNSGDSTHDVGGKQPNAYGLYDMLGNVWEWVEDQSNIDPHRKIMKGGSFYNISRDIRMPNRETPLEDMRHRNVGFRCIAN